MSGLPLDGLRVTELCWVWSGPMLGQQLADLGAEVVKVEWYKRFDLYRTRGVEALRGKLPEEIRRESSFAFQSLNRNKLGFAADLKREEGLDLVQQLIARSDLLLENFTVGTLERMGLTRDVLTSLNPRLVTISLHATGRDSAVESMRGYGPMLSALGGYEEQVVDDAGTFVGSPTFVMSDPNAALFGTLAALAGVLHARRTGRGAVFECSQVEAVASLVATPPPDTEPTIDRIHASADERWVAVTLPAEDPALEQTVGERTAADAVARIRARGGYAAEVVDLPSTETSAEFAGCPVRQSSLHPVSGPREVVAAPWRIDGQRTPIRKPAPVLGEANDYVLRKVLDLDEAAITAVHASGVVDEAAP